MRKNAITPILAVSEKHLNIYKVSTSKPVNYFHDRCLIWSVRKQYSMSWYVKLTVTGVLHELGHTVGYLL